MAIGAGLVWMGFRPNETPVSDDSVAAFESELKKRSEQGEWKEAYEWYMREKLYPDFALDAEHYAAAALHRDGMEPARIRGGARQRAVPLGKWEFVGPRDLAVPYRRWWGPAPVAGRIAGMAWDPNTDFNLHVVSGRGGLFTSANGGVGPNAWMARSDRWSTTQATAVAVDPTNFARIFVGTGDYKGSGNQGQGIMRSTNFGLSWTNVTPEQIGQNISALVIDPEDPNIVVASSGRGTATGRLYRTTDGGFDWDRPTNFNTGNPIADGNWSDLRISLPRPSDGNRNYYAASMNPRSIWRSRNRGASFAQVTSPGNIGSATMINVATSPTVPDRVYALLVNSGIWRSNDAGATWTNITGNFNANWWAQTTYNFCIEVVQMGAGGTEAVVIGTTGLYMCTNPTATSAWTWVDLGQTTVNGPGGQRTLSPALTHNDTHALVRNPRNANVLFVGNDGGAYIFTLDSAGTPTVQNLNTGLPITQFYHAAFHPTAANGILAGTQDNASPSTSTVVSPGTIDDWDNVGAGDGGWSAIDPTNPLVQYVSSQNGGLMRTSDAWATWNRDNPGPDSISAQRPAGTFNFDFISVSEINNANPRFVYHSGTTSMHRWDNQTSTWTMNFANYPAGSGSGRALHVPPGVANRMYIGTANGRFLAVDLTTGTVQNMSTTGLPGRTITDISVHPSNLNSVLITFSGTGTAGHVFRGTLTGNSVGSLGVTWEARNGAGGTGLPNIPVNTIERDPYNPQATWYAGTDVGVMMTNNAGATWTNATEPLNLPNVEIRHLQYVPGTGYLNCATWGRGIWRIKLGESTLNQLTLGTPGKPHPGGDPIQGTLTLNLPAPPPGLPVDLKAYIPGQTGGLQETDLVQLPETVTVREGDTNASFEGTTRPVSVATPIIVQASAGGETYQFELMLSPPTFTVFADPNSVAGGGSSVGTVALQTPAPTGGARISLTSSLPGVLTVPSTVTVPAGQTQATFPIGTSLVSVDESVTITADNGTMSRFAFVTVRVQRVQGVVLSPGMTAGGGSVQGEVFLVAPSLAGTTVTLGSNQAAAQTPASVLVPAGERSAKFTVTTSVVAAPVVAFISATFNTVTNASLMVSPWVVPGTIVFQEVHSDADMSGSYEIEFREPGGGSVFGTATVEVGPNLEFMLACPRATPFDVSMKASHFLRRRVAVNPTGSASVNLSLVNGDVNGDNSVNISDFLALRAAFGTSPGSATWNPMADLNRDGSVGIPDFLILRRNFGATGD